MGKVKFSGEQIKIVNGVKSAPFAVTYHPLLKNLGRIINENFLSLNMNEVSYAIS